MEENEENVSTDEYLEGLMGRRPGRPVRSGSGSIVVTASCPFLLKKAAEKRGISVSKALQEGILMMLNMNDDFLMSDDEYERSLKKGMYHEKKKTFVNTITKLTLGAGPNDIIRGDSDGV